jgi:hypothetical protein
MGFVYICEYVIMCAELSLTDDKGVDLKIMGRGSFNNTDISMLNVGIYHDNTHPNIYLNGIYPLRVINIYRSAPKVPRS